MPSQLEDALRELAALGLVTSDGFAAVRAIELQVEACGRRSASPDATAAASRCVFAGRAVVEVSAVRAAG